MGDYPISRDGAGKLRNLEVKLRWSVGGAGWYERIFVTDRVRRPCQ